MAKYEIYVPQLNWLVGGSKIGGSYNIYCGSVGTDSALGLFGRKIFNYRVWIEVLEDIEIIKVAVYYGVNSFENQNEDEITTEAYEMGEDSIPLIKAYLEMKCDEYFCD